MRLRGLVTALLLALALAACSGGGGEEPSLQPTTRDAGATDTGATADQDRREPPSTRAERRVARLVELWYARADPRVCARMTDRLLEFGWERRGDRGRRACRASMREADPVDGVEIETVTVDGDAAQVEVSYVLDGDARTDTILLVRRNRRWLLDEVAEVENLPEA